MRAEIEDPRRHEPPDDQDQRSGDARRDARSPKTTTSETAPTITVARLASPSVPSHDRSSWIGFEPVTSVPVSLGSSPITTSIAAPNRKPVTTARERNCAIHPILNTARSRNSTPDARVIVATKDARLGSR